MDDDGLPLLISFAVSLLYSGVITPALVLILNVLSMCQNLSQKGKTLVIPLLGLNDCLSHFPIAALKNHCQGSFEKTAFLWA